MNRDVIEFSIAQLDRLNKINDILFNMSIWANNTTTHPLDQPEQVECGFAGCFLGWAAHQQWFDQFGVNLRLNAETIHQGNVICHTNPHLMIAGDQRASVPERDRLDNLDYRHAAAVDAVEKLFDISNKALEFVILPDQYDMPGEEITPGVVADRLRRLLEIGDDAFCEEMTERLQDYTEDEYGGEDE